MRKPNFNWFELLTTAWRRRHSFYLRAALLPLLTLNTVAATRVWTNSPVNSLWSTAANWSNGVPVDGDSVGLLRHPLGSFVSAVNDLTNLTLASIRCEALGYNLSGGTLRLTGDVIAGGPVAGANLTISAPLEIPGPALNIVSTNSGGLTLSGVVKP